MINYFERDDTSWPNNALEEATPAAKDMRVDASRLIDRVELDTDGCGPTWI